MKSDYEIQLQKNLMNKMLKYLRQEKFIVILNGNYKKTVLVYNAKTEIMTKKVKSWNYNGKILGDDTKEKALGGANGDTMFNEIRKAAREKAKKKIIKGAIKRELEDNDIDLSVFED